MNDLHASRGKAHPIGYASSLSTAALKNVRFVPNRRKMQYGALKFSTLGRSTVYYIIKK
jgi:hypothetical protein